MLGHRSVRMTITSLEIPEMQIKAVLDAAADLIPFPATTPTASCRDPFIHESRQGLSFDHQGRSVPGPKSEKIGEVIGITV